MQGQIFSDSDRRCAMREGGEDGHFWCKRFYYEIGIERRGAW